MKYNTTEVELLALIKASINEDVTDFRKILDSRHIDWQRIYDLACLHGVSSLVWDIIPSLSEDIQIPKQIKLSWALRTEKQEKIYDSYCKAIHELTELFNSQDIGVIQMKGVGFSVNYPVPNHREGGDIDIFTYSLNKNKMNDSEAYNHANDLIYKMGIDVDTSYYKHSSFYFHGIPIENHKMFLNCKELHFATILDKHLRQILFKTRNQNNFQIGNRTELSNKRYVIYTPSVEFNTLFLSFHALQHLGAGLTLHNIIDWAILLKKYGWNTPKEIKNRKFLNYCYTLNQLCKDWFNIDVGTPNMSKNAELIAQEIFKPKYDYRKLPKIKAFKILTYKTKRMIYDYWLKQRFLDISLTERIFTSIFTHIKSPKTFFK